MSETRTAQPRMTEKQLQTHVIHAAKQLGWMAYHTWMSAHSEPGFPDLILVRGGRCLAIELKRDGAMATPAQAAWLVALNLVDGIDGYVIRPADWHRGMVEELLR